MNSFKRAVLPGLVVLSCIFWGACGGGHSAPPAPRPLSLGSSGFTAAALNAPYSASLSAGGGTPPYTFSISSGSLPPGLSLNASTGAVTGIPTTFNKNGFAFTAKVTDSAQATATDDLSIYVEGVVIVSSDKQPPLVGSVGVAYSQQLSVSNPTENLAPYKWSISSGSLPLGLTLDKDSGLISGTPTTNGPPDSFTVQAADSEAIPASGSAHYAITVMTITTTSLPLAYVTQPYSATITAGGGSGAYSWCVLDAGGMCDSSQKELPPGLTLMSNLNSATISGTPTQLGTYPFTVQVSDTKKPPSGCSPCSVTANLSILVQLSITTVAPAGTQGVAYDFTLTASGGMAPYTWCVLNAQGACDSSQSELPPGLSLSSSGEITGTPSTAGTFPFTIQATDSSSPPNTATAPLTIVINPAVGNSNLSGTYVFTFNGYSSGNAVFIAGSFAANGQGGFTAGELDYNDGQNPDKESIIGANSTYTISPNGLGTMKLVTVKRTYQFSVAITADGSGRLIQSDISNPQQYGSGVINKVQAGQTASGPFAVGIFGLDSSLNRYAAAGSFKISGLTLTNGTMDIDDAGTATSATFTGQLTAVDPNGRGTATIIFNGNETHLYAYYSITNLQLVLISTEPTSAPANLTLWSVFGQVGFALNNGALAGTSVVELTAVTSGAPEVTAGLLMGQRTSNSCPTYDPASLSFDQNQGGTVSQQSAQGTYCVDSASGRVTLSGFAGMFGGQLPVFYMVSPNRAFVVGTDVAANSGNLEPQAGAPFGNASLSGPYTGGTLTPVSSAVTNAVTWLFADANGNMNGTEDSSGPGGPATQNFTGYTYATDSTGRSVVKDDNANMADIIYVISPTKFIMLPILKLDGTTETNPALSIFSTNSGGTK
jgi:Putative Ig domain